MTHSKIYELALRFASPILPLLRRIAAFRTQRPRGAFRERPGARVQSDTTVAILWLLRCRAARRSVLGERFSSIHR
jgi:hypothetical protein